MHDFKTLMTSNQRLSLANSPFDGRPDFAEVFALNPELPQRWGCPAHCISELFR